MNNYGPSDNSFANSAVDALKSASNPIIDIEAGGPGSGRRKGTIAALKKHGFKKVESIDKDSTKFEKDNNMSWNPKGSAFHSTAHVHTVSVKGDGSFVYREGMNNPVRGQGADDVDLKVGPSAVKPPEPSGYRIKPGGMIRQGAVMHSAAKAICPNCHKPIAACSCLEKMKSSGMADVLDNMKQTSSKINKPVKIAKQKTPKLGSPVIASGFPMDDEARKAMFAKTVGGHSDAADVHEDAGDYHTQMAAKLSTSKSPLAPKLAAAHTKAATAHYAASEAHTDAKTDFSKPATASAQTASASAFKASDKVAAMPVPKVKALKAATKAGSKGSCTEV